MRKLFFTLLTFAGFCLALRSAARQIRRAALVGLLFACVGVAHAQPSIITVSGTLYKSNGQVCANCVLTISKARTGNNTTGSAAQTVTASGSGVISFTAIQRSFATITGSFVRGTYDFSKGVEMFFPAQSTANFDDLQSSADAMLSLVTTGYSPAIVGLTEDLSPSALDYLLTYDVSASGYKKVKIGSLPGGGGGGGSGTVLDFAAGDLPPLFTTAVATSTTTPTLSFTLSNAAAHRFFGNNTGASGAPAFVAIGTGDLPTGIPYANLALTGAVTNADLAGSIANSKLANSAITIAGTSTSLGGTISLDTITGLSTTGLIKRTGANALAIAASGTDYEAPLTFSTGLTRTTNTVTVNTTQNIAKLSNLTSNGFVKTTGGDGTLSVDTATYLTGNQTISFAPTGDVTGSTTGATTLAPALTIGAGKVTNAMLAGSIALSKLSITGTPDGTKFLRDDGSWQTIPGGGDALTSNPLSQFASTTSAQLRVVLSDETGSGAAVFGTAPTITGGGITALTAFGIRSSGTGAFDLNLINTENLTASRNLTLKMNDAARTIDLSGNLTVSGAATVSGTNTGDQTGVTGNAGTATALQTARTINGVSFDGTANITVTAAAGTLTGATLASGVTASSLTSFGTSPTLTTPTIASFINAAHDHTNAAGGGTLNASAIAAGTLPIARGGTQTTTAPSDGKLLIGKTDGTYAVANITAGANVTITNSDGGIQIASSGGASGYATIQEEGSALTQRAAINFIGAGVTAADNSGQSRTDVTIHTAGASQEGTVSTSAQTFAGAKTFNGAFISAAGFRTLRAATATDYTITATADHIVAVTSTAAPRTVTLPDSATAGAGAEYTVVDESNGATANNITLARAGSDTFIGGATSLVLDCSGCSITVYTNGSGTWFVK